MRNVNKILMAIGMLCLWFLNSNYSYAIEENLTLKLNEENEKIINVSLNLRQDNCVTYYMDESGWYGPESFWVNEDGKIVILDSLENRAIVMDNNQNYTINLEKSMTPKDIVLQNEEIYLYDSYWEEFQKYELNGKLLFNGKLPLENNYFRELSIIGDTVAAVTYDGTVIEPIYQSQGKWNIDNILEKNCAKEKAYKESYDITDVIAIDVNGNIYSINTRLVYDVSIMAGEISIVKTNSNGQKVGEYIINSEEFVYFPEHFVRVLNNGEVYIMIPTSNALKIRRVELGNASKTYFENIQKHAIEKEKNYNSAFYDSNAIQRASVTLTREEVLDRANRIALYSWTLSQANVNISGLTSVTLPKYISDIANDHKNQNSWRVSMSGIPYCWGGFYSQYTGNVSERTFADAIKLGYTAGNVNTDGNYKSSTAGLDCSGYASAAYGLSTKKGTGDFLKFGTALSSSAELSKMDFFVKKGHIILFYEWIDESTVLVCETTVSDGKTVVHTKKINQLLINGSYQMRTPW